MTFSKRIVLVVVLQTLVLFAMIGYRQWILSTGTLITLETLPIDPRSLFAGDYINFNYKISEIKLPEDLLDPALTSNETLYVVVTPQDKFWIVKTVSKTKPEVSSPDVVIKGRVTFVYDNKAKVDYGIENYFIPEGEGKKIEKLSSVQSLLSNPSQKITVQVAVDRFGTAAISGVFLNDQELYQEKLF